MVAMYNVSVEMNQAYYYRSEACKGLKNIQYTQTKPTTCIVIHNSTLF